VRARATIEQRFWPKVDRRGPDECWVWLAGRTGSGYGALYAGDGAPSGAMRGAHVVSYEIHVGPVPVGHEVDHRCENEACVNPAHLEAVTHEVHMQRHSGRVTHCALGHELAQKRDRYADGSPRLRQWCPTCRNARRSKGES
jgi:hypothetical protein